MEKATLNAKIYAARELQLPLPLPLPVAIAAAMSWPGQWRKKLVEKLTAAIFENQERAVARSGPRSRPGPAQSSLWSVGPLFTVQLAM